MNLGPYAKALNGLAVGTLLAVSTALVDGAISQSEWVGIIATAVVGGVTIFLADARKVRYGKAIAGSLSAGLGALGTALSTTSLGDLSAGQWVTIVLAFLGNALVVS